MCRVLHLRRPVTRSTQQHVHAHIKIDKSSGPSGNPTPTLWPRAVRLQGNCEQRARASEGVAVAGWRQRFELAPTGNGPDGRRGGLGRARVRKRLETGQLSKSKAAFAVADAVLSSTNKLLPSSIKHEARKLARQSSNLVGIGHASHKVCLLSDDLEDEKEQGRVPSTPALLVRFDRVNSWIRSHR